MRTAFLLLLSALLVGSVAACSDDSEGGGVDCQVFCARSIGCPKDPAPDCISTCQMSVRTCPKESAAAQACAEPKPDSAFHCDEDSDVTRLDEDVCSAEGEALISCVFAAFLAGG